MIRNRRLNALVRDLDLGVTTDDLARKEWDRSAALALLDELEFRGELRTRIMEVVAAEDASWSPALSSTASCSP